MLPKHQSDQLGHFHQVTYDSVSLTSKARRTVTVDSLGHLYIDSQPSNVNKQETVIEEKICCISLHVPIIVAQGEPL